MELFSPTAVLIAFLGVGALALATLLHRFDDRPFSFPIVAVALGYAAFSLPLPLPAPDPVRHGSLVLHLTELGVIVSLMGVGLKIDRLPNWSTWSVTWRLLAFTMPLTIAGVALLGWWALGLTPAAAMLLGAVLAPTDPVLASDVQVGEPNDPEASEPEHDDSVPSDGGETADEEKEDEPRFALTSEAGVNDSLAFPFTWIAIAMATKGVAPGNWLVNWLLIDVAYRLVVGVVLGVAIGWLLGRILMRVPLETDSQKMRAGVGALAATLLLYGLTECAGGYGFLATFIGALTIRHHEREKASHHRSFHAFAEQSEQLFMTMVMIALGGAVAHGLLTALTPPAVALAVALIFVIRPLAGWVGLLGCQRLTPMDRGIVAAFGVRGLGTFFYLAYALDHAIFVERELLWATAGLAVLISVCVHGVAAAPVMRARDRRRERRSAPVAARTALAASTSGQP